VRRLLLSACVLAIAPAGCGSSGSKTVTVTRAAPGITGTTPASTSTQSLRATSSGRRTGPASNPVANLMDFQSPSGNIGCSVVVSIARCDIRSRDWSPPPRPATCPSEVDFGQGLEVYGNRPGRFVCAGDTALDPSATVLQYGSSTVTGPFQCTSASNGMTCADTSTGHGFFISVQSYRTF
jgi:hypothetical protein